MHEEIHVVICLTVIPAKFTNGVKHSLTIEVLILLSENHSELHVSKLS